MKNRLLWVDADTALTEVCTRYFQQCGFDVCTCSSALESVTVLRDFQPDVAVLDAELDWASVRNILEQLCENGDVIAPRVILVTGGETAEELARLTGIPAARCLPKPFRLLAVLDRICAHLDAAQELESDAACCA